MRLVDADVFEVVTFKDKSEDFIEGVEWMLEQLDSTPTVLNIDEVIDETLNEFLTCSGDGSCFIIDGKTYKTDVGYAIEGIELFVERLKEKIGGKA